MERYIRWVRNAWVRLQNDFCKGEFRPKNESDVRCQLYHLLLEEKPKNLENRMVTTEYSIPSLKGKVDMAIIKRNGDPRVFIEIKETSKPSLSVKQIQKRITSDIEKLRWFKKQCGCTRLKKPVIIFLFRGATQEGIGVRLNQELKELSSNYNDVELFFGPSLG